MRVNSYFTLSLFGAGLFTVTLMSFPPEIARSQDTNYTKPPPARIDDTVYTAPVVDRISEKTVELKEITKGIGDNTDATLKQAGQLDKSVGKLAEKLNQPKEVRVDSVKITDTCTVYTPAEPIFVRDTSLDGKTWWGKFFVTNRRLLDECRLHRLRVRVDFPKKCKQ